MPTFYDLYLFHYGQYDRIVKLVSLTYDEASEHADNWMNKNSILNDYLLSTTNSTPWSTESQVIVYNRTSIDYDEIERELNES